MSWSVNRRAGRAVALHLQGAAAEKRELLEMLGIVEPGGHDVLSDDHRSYHLEPLTPAFSPNAPEIEDPEPKRGFTTPPGLAELTPTRKTVSRERQTEPSSHGSWAGRRWHSLRGEPACRECADFQNAKQRDYKARRAEKEGRVYTPRAVPADGESTCGTERGWSRHRRRGEECEPCHRAALAAGLERKRRRRRTKWKAAELAGSPDVPVVHVPGQLDLISGEERSA